MLNIGIVNEIIKVIFCRLSFIIEFNELAGMKPPDETVVILRFKLLNNLKPDISNNINVNIVKKIYMIETFKEIFLILFSGFNDLSSE